MNSLLNGAVRLVMLQFSFSNINLVPKCLRVERKTLESPEEFIARKSRVPGEQCLDSVENVGGLDFLNDLSDAGYVLVDALAKLQAKDGREYAVVRFIFAEENYVNSSDGFQKTKPLFEKSLRQMFCESMWRVRGFLNPFFSDGKIVNGQYVVSVNFEARKPLIDKNGNNLIQWQKNECGDRIGDAPITIEPKLFLRLENGDICVKKKA